MKENQEVQVISCTLQDLLESQHKGTNIPNTNIVGKLYIPEYQRPYVWKEKHINRLLNDWLEYREDNFKDKPLYYLGSIIIHRTGYLLKIIDGQQRITTALLLQKLKFPQVKSGITFTSISSINNIKYILSYLKSIQSGDIFDYNSFDVIANIDFKQINITLVITNSEDLAYTFFETQNTGGVRLGGSDILKAHHLRAITCRKTINYQARKWESIDSENIEYIIQQLTKIRFWDNRKWRHFPFYRDAQGIKDAIIDEYTRRTTNKTNDISYHYSAVKKESGRLLQMHESTYKMLKQPLANGNNTLDYINDYIQLYYTLFKQETDYRIDDAFYDFRKKVLHGKDGTIFLKELMEISLLAYVSRFGFYCLFEATLWFYRAIYSLRISTIRNVREDSVFKFVYDHQFIDNILEVFTTDELFLFLKKHQYNFDTNNADDDKAKGKHIKTLTGYFSGVDSIQYFKEKPKEFDKQLIAAINCKLQNHVRNH